MGNDGFRVAIVAPGDADARLTASKETSRFADLFAAFTEVGVDAQLVIDNDAFRDHVRAELGHADAVLVWVNPIQDGRRRAELDSMLRDLAADGIFVSTHPDVILKLGTKQVLFDTRHIGWGSDTRVYRDAERMLHGLAEQLATGSTRVVKQYRGNGGDGVWRVEIAGDSSTAVTANNAAKDTVKDTAKDTADGTAANTAVNGLDRGLSADRALSSDTALSSDRGLSAGTIIQVRHAKRGSSDERLTLGQFCEQCRIYFADDGRMIDQAFQARVGEGMIRCYLVHGEVAGFGHQAINALIPAPGPDLDAPQPGPRLYHPPTDPRFQELKGQLETEWIPEMQALLDIADHELPVLWDCDFLLGPLDPDGNDTYVLCEINVSSVAPYPESAVPRIVGATIARVRAAAER